MEDIHLVDIRRLRFDIIFMFALSLSLSSYVSADCTIPTNDLYLNSDTTLCSGTYYLTDSGANGVIIFNASNIKLECDGSILIGNGTGGAGVESTAGYGIYSALWSNVSVKNCDIQNYSTGLYLYGTPGNDYGLIENCDFSNNNEQGISTRFVDKIIIRSNNFVSNSYHEGQQSDEAGVYIRQGTYNLITNNSFTGEWQGVRVVNGNHNNITNNTFIDGYEYHDIMVESTGSDYTLIENNYCEGGWAPIEIYNAGNYTTIKNNTIKNTGNTGIFLRGSSNGHTVIVDNIIDNAITGIQSSQGFLATIENNTIENCRTVGLYVVGGVGNEHSDCTLRNNILNDNEDSIWIKHTVGNIISNNIIHNSTTRGIWIQEESYNNTFDSNIINISSRGIYSRNNKGNIIRDTQIILSSEDDFHLGDNSSLIVVNTTYSNISFGWQDYDSMLSYYNYLTVTTSGDNTWTVEVHNKTGGLLVSESTTTGVVEKIEVNEFKQTNLAINYQYPHKINISGLPADMCFNISKNGAYSQSAKTDGVGVLSFEENITENSVLEITPTADIFPPEITIISPQDTKYVHWIWANVSLDEDGSWCGYSLDENTNETMDGSARKWYKNVSGLMQGQHNIRFSCNDTQGYMGHSGLRYFEIVECVIDGDCNSTQYCNTTNKCIDKKGNGAHCDTDGECTSGHCCHNTCRPNCPYCGDGHCDPGEDHNNCPEDCTITTTTTAPTTTISGGGNGGGGGGGGGGFSALPSTKATCYDGLKNCHDNGECEEDIDCGGPCEPCPSCTDGILNQGEEGIDCGGPCGPCETPASCFDGILNQGEEGIDCGGPCEPCPSCSDGILNQGEEGIDCGGPCPSCQEKILALEEDVAINIQIPDEITTGQLYPVNITIENTGDTTFKNLKIKIGDQIRTTNLDLTEKTTRTFHLTAPEKEGEYAIKAEVYTDTIHKEKEEKFRVTETTLILRAIEVDDILYITTKSNTADATIQLEATKDKKTVYINILDTKEHVTEIPAGNYIIKAELKKHNEVINTKKVTPLLEKEHTPTNLNMYLLTPLAIIDTALLIEILRNITRRRR